MSFALATGATLSSTVTVAVFVAVLLLLSVTESVTVLGPISSQSKLLMFREVDLIPQASFEPLSI